jgi:hypothetical protein
MKSDTKKLLIQVVSVLLFSIIVMNFLRPKGGGSNEGIIFIRFIIRYLLICISGLFISDVIIFKMRRPKFVASILSLFAYFGGIFLGSILGILFASLIHPFIGIYAYHLEEMSPFVTSVICMVLSYHFVYNRVRW